MSLPLAKLGYRIQPLLGSLIQFLESASGTKRDKWQRKLPDPGTLPASGCEHHRPVTPPPRLAPPQTAEIEESPLRGSRAVFHRRKGLCADHCHAKLFCSHSAH